MTNTAKLQTYLDKFLVPVLNGIKNHPALFAVEVINELEGIVDAGKSNSEERFRNLSFNQLLIRLVSCYQMVTVVSC